MSTDEAKINISRSTTYADSLRKYRILVDKVEIGRIEEGSTLSFPIAPGNHQIYLKIDWCRSNIIDFSATSGEEINFDCGSSLSGWRILLWWLYMTIWWNKYLWLRKKI